ncbi:MAG: tail fiber domain-containing protein [Holophagales bacterium]|nr:tail fiber domain-containing protein [Holophagales bacterium]
MTGPATGSAEDGTIPVRNWHAPAYWAVPIPDAGPRSARVEEPETEAAPLATSTLAFVGITPCRVADTRQPPPGEFGQPWMPASTVRSFTLTGQCGIPADAEAVSFNFTVTNTAGAGFLLAYPAGGSVPGVSTLNYLASQTIANAAVVPLGTLGSGKGISAIPGVAGFDLIIDVNGYYTAQGVVSSLNGRTGAVSVTAGANVAVTPSGQNIQVTAGPLVSSLEGLTGVVDVAPTNGTTVTAGSGTLTIGTNATSSSVASTLVARDASAGFVAGTVDLVGSPFLLTQAGTRLLHRTGTTKNTFFGVSAGGTGTTGDGLTAFGYSALPASSTGNANSAFGSRTLEACTTGSTNSAFGSMALDEIVSSTENAAFGVSSLGQLTNGDGNSAFGTGSLGTLTSGNNNVGIGKSAGSGLQTGNNNIYIGFNTGPVELSESNTTRIGNDSSAAAYLRGVSGASIGTASAVYVNSSGRLGTVTSSARFKKDVAPLGDPAPLLMELRPVSFLYRADDTMTPQVGLIAEEVEKVAPHLVVRDEKGQLLSVRYDQLVPMLLAEAQRLERDNERLRAALEGLTERMAAHRGSKGTSCARPPRKP